MNQNSEMTRWTLPTNPDFYALHKGAIKIYGATIIFVQMIWLFFSVSPFASLLSSNVQAVAPYALLTATILLFGLHYVLHELLRYVAFNALDKDPNTVNSVMHYVIIALIVAANFALDLQGTTRFLRKEDTFKSERASEQTSHRTDFDKVTARQQAELSTLAMSHKEEIQAVFQSFEPALKGIKNRKCYDDFDLKKRSKDYERKVAEQNAAVATIKTAYTALQRTTLAQHTSERNRLTANADTRTASIDAADQDNAAKSESYGWNVSLICLLILLAATYQATDLRVMSGQKPVSRFTIADATGSTTSKLADVMSDIWQRKSHQWLAEFHGWATSETRELDTLDGAFKLKGGVYETQQQQLPPPTTPPTSGNNNTPPSGGNGGGGGNNGGGPSVPVTPPAPVESLTIVRKQHYSTLSIDDKDTIYNQPISGISQIHWNVAINKIDPIVCFFANGLFMLDPEDAKRTQELAKNYDEQPQLAAPVQIEKASPALKDRLANFSSYPTNTRVNITITMSKDFGIPYAEMDAILVKLDPMCTVKNEDLEFMQTESLGNLGMAVGELKIAQKAKMTITPTPSVVAEKTVATPVAHVQPETTVAQPILTVPQQNAQIIYTELDDKLNLLKSKLQKEGRSNFTNKEADNSSIRSRICKILDEATGALIVRNAKCNPSVLADFYRVAKEKLALMKEFETTPYGGVEDFCTIVENRLGKEVTND